jgi:iron complex outermembrane recepter protein
VAPVRRRGTCSATRHRFDAANLTPQLPGFVTLNLSASYRLTPHVQFFASAENVTGANTTPAHVLADRCRVSGAGPNATNPWADSPPGHAVT